MFSWARVVVSLEGRRALSAAVSVGEGGGDCSVCGERDRVVGWVGVVVTGDDAGC